MVAKADKIALLALKYRYLLPRFSERIILTFFRLLTEVQLILIRIFRPDFFVRGKRISS
ncbi:hypothetical protein DSUL_140050 [Desulfovibrionales bacterium]